MIKSSCGVCKYWEQDNILSGANETEQDIGFCFRYPPESKVNPHDGGVITLYPATKSTAWCGEFTPKLATVN